MYQLSLGVEAGMVQGRLQQDAWHLLFAALGAMAVAPMNWRNSRRAYWINLILVSVVDIGFIALIVLPGYMPTRLAGLPGPLLWLAARVCSSWAQWTVPASRRGLTKLA
ncbi:hypothetical protein [Chitinimonas lacunae]|uniref:Rod shape-determining protein MreD n=1 Tax=Chitinimonas lacunae TaxID=1963018 RepID=A0ABV8ML03_9NEIS